MKLPWMDSPLRELVVLAVLAALVEAIRRLQ
jgi:hypothetical protein